MRQRTLALGIVLALLALTACGVAPARLSVADAWVRAASGGGTGAAYLTILNGGGADALVRVESDAADSVELHAMMIENNVMRMSPAQLVDIPAQGRAELRPGGSHVMLIGLRRDLRAGDVVRLTLTFRSSASIAVDAQVRAP